MEQDVLELAKEVLTEEIRGLERLRDRLGDAFWQAVQLIKSRKGRVIVTGVGKSGIVAKKIAATLTSLGTPAIYLHPTESLHGDLGIVDKDDVVLAVSKSGESDEFQMLIPLLKRWGLPIIAITANPDSDLAQQADITILIDVPKEAGPLEVVPTVSTTVTMALGDALAVALLYEKEFRLEDFVNLHPGGAIGKKLWFRVRDMMLTGPEHVPVVHTTSSMKEVILEMTTKRGITSVINDAGEVVGVITDGDLRRLLERVSNPFHLKAQDVMTTQPKVIGPDELAVTAARKMEEYGITALIVVDEQRHPIGIIHLHDLMRSRVV